MTDSLQVSISTISPIYVPVELKTGADRTSSHYAKFQETIDGNFESVTLSQITEVTAEYENLDQDSWEHRLFIWENNELDPDLQIHVFPNNIGIVVIKQTFDYNGNTKALEKTAQKISKQRIDNIYKAFTEQLRFICAKELGDYFILDTKAAPEAQVFWVSRTILMNTEDLATPLFQKLTTEWLTHTYRPEDAKDILAKRQTFSMTWLNYVIVDLRQPADQRFDSMILAQYYYTAQEHCNKLLKQAIESAYNGSKTVDAQQKLTRSRVVTRLHQVDYHEHLKYLPPSKRKLLEDILACWNFDQIRSNGQRMIEIGSSKIDETENAKRERSSLLTDLLLVALSFFTVFELSIYLTEFSREMMSRPTLDFNDENSSFMLEFIAGIDTDVMFGSGFLLTLLLVVVYKVIKSR